MPVGEVVVRRAPQDVRPTRHARDRATHRASSRPRRRTLVGVSVLAAVGGAAVTTTLLLSGAGPHVGDTGAAPRQAASDLDPSPVADETGGVTCWDGTAATRAKECGMPSGRTGLVTVFPSLDRSCAATAPAVGGRAEVFTCRGSGFVIRYTRWQPGFDRFSVFSQDNRGLGSAWVVGHEFAGRRWASRVQTSDGVRHFRWTATYRAQPFSVEVQATSLAGRGVGMDAVEAVAPHRLGRGPDSR